jgi:hypothetical protein
MNKLILTLGFATAAAFATNAPVAPTPGIPTPPALEIPTGTQVDSLLKLEKAQWQKDSATFAAEGLRDSVKFEMDLAKLPDSLRNAINAKRVAIEVRVAEFQKLRGEEIKVKLDSLAFEHKAHRDSVIAKLPAVTQAKIKAQLVEIDARRAELKIRIAADRAELKARIEAAKAAKAAATTSP